MIKFVDFISTPEEKHLGIATVNFDDKMLLRYKVMKRNDNGNMFFKPASHKVGEEYIDAFMFDSRILETEIDRCIRTGLSGQTMNHVEPVIKNDDKDDLVPF